MSNKTPAIISAVLTIILLILTSIVLTLGQLVALNGFSERVGTIALVTSLVCQSAGGILAVILAWQLANLFIAKFNWNKVLAVLISVFSGVIVGGGISLLSLFVSVILAEEIR